MVETNSQPGVELSSQSVMVTVMGMGAILPMAVRILVGIGTEGVTVIFQF